MNRPPGSDLARTYNGFLGSCMQNTMVQALRVFNVVFKGMIPFWNASMFIVSRIMQGNVFPTLSAEILAVQQIGMSLFNLCQHLVLSIFAWMQTVIVSCPEANGDACFDLGDHLPSMQSTWLDRTTHVHPRPGSGLCFSDYWPEGFG